ncbi:hypothetical protein OA010_01485 [Luminiphilus sp.]|jgi:hypothetical protein|nr:hypothetical protein [Luminiphilus sp.]
MSVILLDFYFRGPGFGSLKRLLGFTYVPSRISRAADRIPSNVNKLPVAKYVGGIFVIGDFAKNI